MINYLKDFALRFDWSFPSTSSRNWHPELNDIHIAEAINICPHQLHISDDIGEDEQEAIQKWLGSEPNGLWFRKTIMLHDLIMFELEADAVLFKLRFL